MTTKAGLSAQRKVAELLSDGNWYSIASIAKSTGLGAEAIDVLYRMEQIGAVECEIIGGRSRYRDAAQAGSLKPQPRKKPGPKPKTKPEPAPPPELPPQAVQAEPPTRAAELLSEDDTVDVPFLPIKANTGEQPISERTLKIGGFSDGSFTISRSHGIRSELTLTREEAQQVVAFIQRFIHMEAA
ncbi:hypothetical protein A7Q03_06190 [Eikenella sp. NML99-0057]|uniref:hypothetical protein n=1 Tax=Eikenella sp. NML99-0057 TaxID=1795834 RepID=UPI0007E28A23|nr:hypothetical protein [Eikenella sp. NML99-0057]OAM45103.1 hypothetical protein A7Q03_06190 [Eikenella sp. NML99-0057]